LVGFARESEFSGKSDKGFCQTREVVVMISQKLTLQGLRIIQAPCADHLPSLAKSQRRERERERALDIQKPGPMHEKRIFLKENKHDSGR
jgi:hypothetical protein